MRRSTSLVSIVFFVATATAASAAADLVPHPDPSLDFSERFEWALESAPGDGGFWIAYSIERWLPQGIFFNGGWTWRQRHGVPLTDLLSGRASAGNNEDDARREIAILLAYPSAGAPPAGVSVASPHPS